MEGIGWSQHLKWQEEFGQQNINSCRISVVAFPVRLLKNCCLFCLTIRFSTFTEQHKMSLLFRLGL